MRVRQRTRVRFKASSRARAEGGKRKIAKGSTGRSEPVGGRRPSGGVLARAHWWPEEKKPEEASLPAPPLGRLALPLLAPAPLSGLESALSGWCARSQSPPPTSSGTSSSTAATAHLLPPPPQTLSPLLSYTVLALCRLSGKRKALKCASPYVPCARILPPLGPPPQRWVSLGEHWWGPVAGAIPCALCVPGLGLGWLGKEAMQGMHTRV